MKIGISIILSLVIGLVGGFFAGQEYTKYKIRSEIEKAFTAPSTKNTKSTSATAIEEDQKQLDEELKKMKTIDKAIGEELSLATINFKINSVKEENLIQGSYSSPKVAEEGTKFVILNITATNTTKGRFPFETNSLMLIDERNTKYNPYNDTIGNIDDYMDYQELSPNIPKTGVLVFQLPKTSTSYSFIIAKAGTNELYNIKLK